MNHKKEVHKMSAISLVVSVTGAATLDDGRVIQVRDMLGFAEKVENKW